MSVIERSLDEDLTMLFASDPETMRDPNPVFERLRAESPAHEFGPMILFSHYDDVKKIVETSELFSSQMARRGASRTEAVRDAFSPELQAMFDSNFAVEGTFITQSDGEDHRRRRDLMKRHFTPRRIADLGDNAQRYTDDMLTQWSREGGVTDLSVFAYRLPLMLGGDLLDIPHEDADTLVRLVDLIAHGLFGMQGAEALRGGYDAHQEMAKYVEGVLDRHRSAIERSELIDALMSAEESEELAAQQLSAMFIELILGSYETTRSLMATGMLELLRDPEQWERLKADPSLAGKAVDELMRVISPVQWTVRIAEEDTEVGGVTIPKDFTAIAILASANRDEALFESPNDLDITRANARAHLAFGHGRHFCLGQALARLEGEIAFSTIARRFPEMEIATDEIKWAGSAQLRRVAALPVRLGPDHGE